MNMQKCKYVYDCDCKIINKCDHHLIEVIDSLSESV